MTTITFTYYARKLDDGRHRVNLFVKQLEPTWDDTPRNERMAITDAAQIVREIVRDNPKGEEDLLCREGDPCPDMFPIFMFAIGVNWNRKCRCAHYSNICYQRYAMDGVWNPVASLGMEQMRYMMSCLRKFEKAKVSAS